MLQDNNVLGRCNKSVREDDKLLQRPWQLLDYTQMRHSATRSCTGGIYSCMTCCQQVGH